MWSVCNFLPVHLTAGDPHPLNSLENLKENVPWVVALLSSVLTHAVCTDAAEPFVQNLKYLCTTQ